MLSAIVQQHAQYCEVVHMNLERTWKGNIQTIILVIKIKLIMRKINRVSQRKHSLQILTM